MSRRMLRRGFTLVELIVVILVIGILIALLLPAIGCSRRVEHRMKCINRMKQLGLAFHNFNEQFQRLPPSCHVERDPDSGQITALDGWSWIVDLLPEMEAEALWQTLDIDGKPLVEPDDAPNGSTPHSDALATVMNELRCPVYQGDPHTDRSQTQMLTNYKVMGATHIESLNVASPNPTTPKYVPEASHPDGACFPGSRLTFRDFKNDGTANTILIITRNSGDPTGPCSD